MFPFCPHCGRSLDQEQRPGQTVLCAHCGQQVGVGPLPEKPAVVDQTEELLRRGVAARCPLCGQVVEVKARGTARTFVPHYAAGPQRRMCPNGGKPLPAESPAATPAPAPAPGRKDLSGFMTRDRTRVVLCRKDADPTIEELILEYLDKADRVRLQIEALRELLGPDFRMGAYPPPLNRAHLAVWGNATACVIARRHERGGYEAMSDAEVAEILADLKQHKQRFFP
jgi:DNA-directed RNA polymerase subunit RPC12/RpoP